MAVSVQEKEEEVKVRASPDERTRGEIAVPSVDPKERTIRENPKLPILLTPAVPLPSRLNEKESTAVSLVLDLTVVLERVSLTDVLPDSLMSNTFSVVPLR
jgi:hypothetical protein